jgi:transcriptional regulator with XRE-family HTH domain
MTLLTIGTRIKEHRNKLGFSQEKIAELVGTSRQAVTKWEADQSIPCMENLITLAEIFGVPLTELTNGENTDTLKEPSAVSAQFKGKVDTWWYIFIIGFNLFMAFIAYICYEDTVSFSIVTGIITLMLPFFLVITLNNYVALHNGKLTIHFGFFKKTIDCKDIISIEKTRTPEAGMALSFDRLLITSDKGRYIISAMDNDDFINQLVRCNGGVEVVGRK